MLDPSQGPLAHRKITGLPLPLVDWSWKYTLPELGRGVFAPQRAPSVKPPLEGVRDVFIETSEIPFFHLYSSVPLLSSLQFPVKMKSCSKWGEVGEAEVIFKRVSGFEQLGGGCLEQG